MYRYVYLILTCKLMECYHWLVKGRVQCGREIETTTIGPQPVKCPSLAADTWFLLGILYITDVHFARDAYTLPIQSRLHDRLGCFRGTTTQVSPLASQHQHFHMSFGKTRSHLLENKLWYDWFVYGRSKTRLEPWPPSIPTKDGSKGFSLDQTRQAKYSSLIGCLRSNRNSPS